jgi:hypothetical protein
MRMWAVLGTLLFTLGAAVSGGCGPILDGAFVYDCSGQILDAGTHQPVSGVQVVLTVDEMGAQELADWFAENPALTVPVDDKGSYSAQAITGLAWGVPSHPWAPLQVPPTPLLERIFVHVLRNTQWLSIEVPLTGQDQPEGGTVLVPTVYVSDAGLSLTPGQ